MEKIRIQDDLYNYVNQEWLETAVIPDGMPATGGFNTLNEKVESDLINDFNEMIKSGSYENDHIRYACKLFSLFKDTKRRNREKMRPAMKYLNKINKIQNMTSFNRNLKDLVLNKLPLPFDLDVTADLKNSVNNCLLLNSPSTILPDSSYYKPEMEQQKQMMLGLWSNMAKMILAETKLTPEEQEVYLSDTLKFDALIGPVVLSHEDMSDYVKLFNHVKTRTVSSMVKPVKFRKLLTDLFGTVPEDVVVTDLKYFKEFKNIFNEENFEMYRHWAYVIALLQSTSFLSEHLREVGSMFRNALMGIDKAMPLEKFAYNVTAEIYSEPVGLYYGKKYFGYEARKDIESIANDIIKQYIVRVNNSDILSEETKKKAVLKLEKINVKMGFPDNVDKVYDSYVFDDSTSLLDVVVKTRRLFTEHEFSKLYEKVDKKKWHMGGHIVNAMYNPTDNDITFPAAILQPPFYSIKQSRSANLGGIGAVIGHEISHAFDNNGAKCDENGCLNNWWTKEDFKKFKARTKDMIKEFEGIELPWGKVNSSFIVSENIADNGGMAVTLDLMKKLKNASYEDYFITWAKVWCMKAKPEYLQLLLTVDVHAPNILRANMPPRNFPEWYDTFKVSNKDKMYISPKKRVVIW